MANQLKKISFSCATNCSKISMGCDSKRNYRFLPMTNHTKSIAKIMYLNPLGSNSYDQIFADLLKTNKYPESEIHVTSLNETAGRFTNLEYRTYEAMVTGDIIRATRQASKEGFDALIIGCFYDTALQDAREIAGDMLVLGPCQSSIELVSKLANNFSVIVGRSKWINQMTGVVRSYGYGSYLASFRDIGMNVVELQKDPGATAEKLLEAGRKAIDEDRAESLILGCTIEFGFFKTMEAELKVPIIDPTFAALKSAEHSVMTTKQFGWKPSRKWSCEAPPEEEVKQFGIFAKDYEFGNRIVLESKG